MIRKGDRVAIKAEYMDDAKDNDVVRVAIEDEYTSHTGVRLVRVQSQLPEFALALWPIRLERVECLQLAENGK